MNFIPPVCFLDDTPPVQYIPKEEKPTEAISTPKIRRKKSLTSLWTRKESVEDVPPLPQTPTAFATPSFRTNETSGSFSANETDSLNYVAHSGPAAPEAEELVTSGISFMDLSDSSGDEKYQRSILLHRLRRAISKTDLTAPDSNPSVMPSSPETDSRCSRVRACRFTEAKESAALRLSSYTNTSSAELTSLRSLGSWNSPLSIRSEPEPSPRALENPPLDPEFEFDKFMESNKAQVADLPRSEIPGLASKCGKSAPPVDKPRARKYETVSVQATRESIHGYASFLSKAKTRGLPMPDMIDEDEGEWNRAVDWVRDQEAKRVACEAKAAEVDKKIRKSQEAQQAQREADWQNKIGLARQFIRRTSTSWAPQRNSHELRTDDDCRDAIAEALDLVSKDQSLDPGFTELRKRFFAGITNSFSRSTYERPPKSAPLPCRPGWQSPDETDRQLQYSPIPSHLLARSSTTKVSQQSYHSCPVSPVGSSRFESQQSPLPQVKTTTDENVFDGLGIQMETPDPDKRNMALDGCGPLIHSEPASPDASPLSQRNAFGPGQSSSSCSTPGSSQYFSPSNKPTPESSTNVIGDAELRDQLQSSAEATLVNARIFKVDRDSKVQDRWVPKRCSTLYQTIDAARELAEVRMGLSPVAVSSPTFQRKDSKLDVSRPPIKKVQSTPAARNVFKRAAKNPTLRAMVSSMSMRSPDATEMISSPLTPISNHPAFRADPGTPLTPKLAGNRPTRAQRVQSTRKGPRASTSTASDDPVLTPLSITVSESSSQKSSHSAVIGEERWAQRIRQKMKVEQTWQDRGLLSAPVELSTVCEPSDLPSAQSCQPGISKIPQQSMLQTPTPPALLSSKPVTRSSSSPAIGQKLSPNLSRKTQDSPTPLNIKKLSSTPKGQLGLSLPDSPAPLQVAKLRKHPAVRRVLVEQNFKDAAENRGLPPSFNGDSDPFAKSGSGSKGDEDWPLSDASTNNAALEDQQPPEQSPLDGQFDRIITSWRHASATQEFMPSTPLPPKSVDVAGKHKYVRNYLELEVLCAPAAGKTHPNHPYHWESINVMCKDVHSNVRNSSGTNSTGDGDDTVRFCSFCGETCCYFGQQLGRASIQTKGRDQTLEELKNQARSHVYFLRGTCPEGIEDYQILMECGLCERVCCPGCAKICQYPLCSEPVCKECVELEQGICRQH